MNVKKEKIFEYYNKDTLNIRDKKIRKLKKKWDRIIKIPTNFEYELDLNIEYSEKNTARWQHFCFPQTRVVLLWNQFATTESARRFGAKIQIF